MFRPLSGHLQAMKLHKINITIESSFCLGTLRYDCLSVPVCVNTKMLKYYNYNPPQFISRFSMYSTNLRDFDIHRTVHRDIFL